MDQFGQFLFRHFHCSMGRVIIASGHCIRNSTSKGIIYTNYISQRQPSHTHILPIYFSFQIRNIGLSFATVVQSITSFAMLKMFPYISDAFGVVGSMYLFAGFTLSGGLFVFFCMPETKGRTFEGIAELLRK